VRVLYVVASQVTYRDWRARCLPERGMFTRSWIHGDDSWQQ